jgi:hypothetical protein
MSNIDMHIAHDNHPAAYAASALATLISISAWSSAETTLPRNVPLNFAQLQSK